MMQRTCRDDRVERTAGALLPIGRVERAANKFDPTRELLHAFAPETNHLFRTVVTYRAGFGPIRQDRGGERAVTGAQVEDADRLLARMRQHENNGLPLHVADRSLLLRPLIPAIDESAAFPRAIVWRLLFHALNNRRRARNCQAI